MLIFTLTPLYVSPPPPFFSPQYHFQSHFSPFISPETVYYTLIFLVHLACSHVFSFSPFHCHLVLLLVLSFSFILLSSSFILYPILSSLFPSPLLYHFIVILAAGFSSPPLPSSFLQPLSDCMSEHAYVHLTHKAKLWISTPMFIPLISKSPQQCGGIMKLHNPNTQLSWDP